MSLEPQLLHFDGEFSSVDDLVVDTLTGRNFGWLPTERATAIAHVARVVRGDLGIRPRFIVDLGGHGIPYQVALQGTDPDLPVQLRIPAEYRINVRTASDEEIVRAVGKVIKAYLGSLRFGTRSTFRRLGSPYDLFLKKNQIANRFELGQTNTKYAELLRSAVNQNKDFLWVSSTDGDFKLHSQPYQFDRLELQGLRIFMSKQQDDKRRPHVGNCASCHVPPEFTDHRVHNNGATQDEYDSIWGIGAFAALSIPQLDKRNASPDLFLPVSFTHPKALGVFRAEPSRELPGYVDLGAWNVEANNDLPRPQTALTNVLCEEAHARGHKDCSQNHLLELAIATFKTPSIRDLGQSSPYFHSGAFSTIEDVLKFYVKVSQMAREGLIRNGAPQLADVAIDASDIVALAAFLRSLNEDYR